MAVISLGSLFNPPFYGNRWDSSITHAPKGDTYSSISNPNQSTHTMPHPPKEALATGFSALKKYLRYDALAGFSVSLIAMPLCLGIALASGVPPIAGLFTAIIGGIIASRIAGSHLTISGPAAGLIVITVSAVESLGGGNHAIGYPFALAAIVLSGVLVALFGLLRVGKLGDFFPSAAVHGMLSAIGLIIMIKQFFPAIGVAAPKGELLEVAAEIPAALGELNPYVVFIALAALAVLIIHPRVKAKWFKMIPAPLLVLIVTIPMAHAFDFFNAHSYSFMGEDHQVGPNFLVNLPHKISDGITLPDFGLIGTGKFWVAVVSFALVSGIESLLSAKAVDTLDPWKRRSNLNRDLLAMGGGSAFAGAIGGLPMISEIVRSSANINNGARTQWSNFFHGGFLLVFLLLLAPVIEQIPMSALAAMLIFTGFRLAAPKQFIDMFRIGPKQFAAFVITIITVLATDLLIGIGVGILVEYLLQVSTGANFRHTFKVPMAQQATGEQLHLSPRGALLFTSYLSLKGLVLHNKTYKKVILDLKDVTLIDHTVMHALHNLHAEMEESGSHLEIVGMDALGGVTAHPLSDHRPGLRKIAAPGITALQKEWAKAAQALGLPVAYPSSIAEEWQGFEFLRGEHLDIQHAEITVSGQPRLVVADFGVRSGALLTESMDTATLLLLHVPETLSVPSFLLETETNMDRLLDHLTGDDIDFEDFPAFSERFILRGSDTAAIRAFFTPKRIAILQEYDDYEIESVGDRLLIRHQSGRVQPHQLDGMVRFGRLVASMIDDKNSSMPLQSAV
jgi:MFS superfamily sulfate permease-like transporter